MRPSAGRCLLALALAAPACGGGSADPPQRGTAVPGAAGQLGEPPTIVLITLDTVRREHLGCYGYFRDTTPHIDALAAEGLLFERAVASMASTLPSHLTMLTGLYPHQHGMNSNRRSASVAYVSELGRLSAAAVLARCGYRTAAFVSATPLSETTGIQVGFETFSCPPAGSTRRAAETNAEALAWLEAEASGPGPLFLWVHYFDPHEPYDPVAPYDARFATDARQEHWVRARGIDPSALTERLGRSQRVQRHFLGMEPAPEEPAAAAQVEITLARIADLMNRYDGELAYLDDQLGILLDALRRHGRYADAVLVLVGDHGQSLGENAWLGHGAITNVNLFVPLIVRLPLGLVPQPQRVGALVSLADLMPTVLARFELPGSELFRGQFEGEDVLSGSFRRDSALAERTADRLLDGERSPQFALLSGRWKLVHRPWGQDELYDLSGAGEFVDVRSRHTEVAARLAAELRSILARKPALLEREQALDAELLRSLEDLGYAGGEGNEEPEDR